MRIRTIKPSFWRSDDITALPRDLRLLFIGLWSYVDDNGVGLDDYRQITADLFALEEDQTSYREYVRDGLAILSRHLLVVRYMVNDKGYLFIRTWDEHQKVDRPNKARYPRPSAGSDPPTSTNGQVKDHAGPSSRESRESPSSVVGSLEFGTEEQRNKSKHLRTPTAEVGHTAATDDQHASPKPAVVPIKRRADETFAQFWAAYPRKKSKQYARTVWDKAIKRAEPETIIAAAQAFAASKPDLQYTLYPATWLNRMAWEDELDSPTASSNGYKPYSDPPDSSIYHQGFQ